jgi:hypothetical protein
MRSESMAVENAKEVFETYLPKRLKDKSDLAEKINASYKFEVTGDGGGTWVVDLTSRAARSARAMARQAARSP